MNRILHRVISYIFYLFRSIHLHGVHSPFIFQIHQDIIKDKHHYYAFKKIESVRAKLLLTSKKVEIEDFGAGSTLHKKKYRAISEIAKSTSTKPKYAQMLFKLAYQQKPQNILEFGTSLGLTTAYLAKACPAAKIISMEGASEVAKIAEVNFKKLDIHNIKVVRGEFSDNLSSALQELSQVDLVFFDGNHQQEATLKYFEECLKYAHKNSVFIFDDIYWSQGMTSAWRKVKAHPKVKQTVDIYQMGWVFFREEQMKEDFTVYP